MKKLIVVFMAAAVLFSLTACGSVVKNSETTEKTKENLFESESTTLSETEKVLNNNYFYGKSFAGGTGYVKLSDGTEYYEYTGGSMKIDFSFDNGGDAMECGITLVLDGIYQSFKLTDKNGETTDEAYMHTINANTTEAVNFSLEFTPNTGKSGDELNIAVGTMVMPSYTNIYDGTQGGYGLPIYHAYNAASGITVKMKADAPTQQKGAELPVKKERMTEIHKSKFAGTDLDPFEYDYRFLLYTDIKTLETGESVLNIADGKESEITLDVFGKADEYRAALFINHELIHFPNGGTYFDFAVNNKEITRVTLPVDTSELDENNHAYVVLFHKNNGELSIPDSTYIFADKSDTCFCIVNKNQDSTEVNSNEN